MTERFLVTSALPYANGPIHLGHLAGAYLPADVFVRYRRMTGADVVYICGSDEHGAAIVIRGLQSGETPQSIVDRYHGMAKADFERFGMSFDHYGRTSSKTHHETAREWFRLLEPTFVKKTGEQMYDPKAKLFLADRFVIGTCPHCGHDSAYGDQCENCGTALSPAELKDPRSTVSDATPEMRETTHWYLPMGQHQERLEAWFDTKSHWKTNVTGQVHSWFKAGLKDRGMTRDLPWGIPVPTDIAEASDIDPEGKVLYVWLEAPIGYLSATREWAQLRNEPDAWRPYWQDDGTRLVHFIGKDNIVFHTLTFPLMIMLHGDLGEHYVLPDNVPANEFLNLEGKKLSTSRGWAVWLGEALDAFPADYLRYSLLRSLPETKDADFSWGDFQTHINSELADNFGNFVNRTVQFVHKYGDGTVPAAPAAGKRPEVDALWDEVRLHASELGTAIEEYRMREAVQSLMAIGRAGNKFFNDAEPWRTRREDEAHCAGTLHTCLQLCASLSVFAAPFLPFTAERLQKMLRLEGVQGSGPDAPADTIGWNDAKQPLLKAGHALGEAEILVSKVPDEAVKAQRDKLEAAAEAAAAEEAEYAKAKEPIVFDDFVKLDLRVGKVLSAERVKKSKKLIKCIVDIGFEERQILAGVADQMSAEDLEGAQVIVVANLPPRKMAGLESQGMLLMAENREGKLVRVQADSEPGSTVS